MSRPASRFPDPATAPGDEPLAWGGDLQPHTLMDAYCHGIFPWPSDDETLFWWSPDPRAEIPLDGIKVSRSLRKTIASGRFTNTVDQAFNDVVAGCQDRPDEGTWIIKGLAEAYDNLHRAGFAHSVETWDSQTGELVGGLYGISVGTVFTGESMFHRATDASKAALVHLTVHLRQRGYTLLDVQMPTDHLVSMGAITISRRSFLSALAESRDAPATFAD